MNKKEKKQAADLADVVGAACQGVPNYLVITVLFSIASRVLVEASDTKVGAIMEAASCMLALMGTVEKNWDSDHPSVKP